MKTLAFVHRNDTRFSVGDFSPVLSIFSHYELGNTVSPFLLLDHLGPGNLKAGSSTNGVSEHPHRGFETVTIMFQGELEHRDSSGGGGVIQAGDVQWMTAASGIMHKESFSAEFAKSGGRFEMLQLWVNLPAKDKMNPPRYQSLKNNVIPKIELDNDAGFVRVIAGEYDDHIGSAITHSPMQVFDVFVKKGHSLQLPAKAGDTTLLYMRSGHAQFQADDAEKWDDHGLAVMSNLEENVELTALYDSHFLYLSAAPFHEPINGHGPFVMNTYDEILQAFDDIKTGNFIRYAAAEIATEKTTE